MSTASFDERPFGLPCAADLPWGSHFCVFYASEAELLDVVVPFIRAGLESNEFCSWEIRVSPRRRGSHARARRAHSRLRQVRGSRTDRDRRVADRGARAGGEGRRGARAAARPGDPRRLRRSQARPPFRRECGTAGARRHRRDLPWTEHHRRVALSADRRSGLSSFMQVVQDHRFALVCNAGRWEVLEGSEARTAREALARSEEKLRSLFSEHVGGVCLPPHRAGRRTAGPATTSSSR